VPATGLTREVTDLVSCSRSVGRCAVAVEVWREPGHRDLIELCAPPDCCEPPGLRPPARRPTSRNEPGAPRPISRPSVASSATPHERSTPCSSRPSRQQNLTSSTRLDGYRSIGCRTARSDCRGTDAGAYCPSPAGPGSTTVCLPSSDGYCLGAGSGARATAALKRFENRFDARAAREVRTRPPRMTLDG
jgi:hypothetical protein